jgi:hypothetical protein
LGRVANSVRSGRRGLQSARPPALSRTCWRANSAITRRPIGRLKSSRATGVELERSTLAGWVGGACWWLEALHERLCKDVLASEHPFCQRHVGAGARSRQRTHEDRATVGLCSRCRSPISKNWSPATYCAFDGRFGCVKIGKAAAARGARSRAHETHFTMQFDVSAIDPRCVSAAQAEKNLEWVF